MTESSGLASVPWQVSVSFTLAINVRAREKERVAGYDLTRKMENYNVMKAL